MSRVALKGEDPKEVGRDVRRLVKDFTTVRYCLNDPELLDAMIDAFLRSGAGRGS
jgi:hypothetical protein